MDSESSEHKSQWKQWLAALAASSTLFSVDTIDVVWMNTRSDEQGIPAPLIETMLIIVGAILGAVFADCFGRKNSLLMMMIFVIPRVTSFSYGLGSYGVSTIFIYIGSGIMCTLVPLYISEIAGTSNRRNLMAMQLSVVSSGVFAAETTIILQGYLHQWYGSSMVLGIAFLAVPISFHAIILGVFPETQQYLNWEKMCGGVADSLASFRKMKSIETSENTANLSVNHDVNNGAQGCGGKFRELFLVSQNRNGLAVIFTLIVIKWIIGLGLIDLFTTKMVENTCIQRYNYLVMIFFAITFTFSVFIMLTIGAFERRLSLLVVIIGSFAASIIGMTKWANYELVLFGVSCLRYFSRLIFVGVTLAYVGKFFPINVRAMAVAMVICFEILSRNIIFGLERMLRKSEIIDYDLQNVCLITGAHTIAFFLIMIFFPEKKKTPRSEISIGTSTGIRYL